MVRLCGCGCGREVRAWFVKGHHRRARTRDAQGRKRCPSCEEWKPFTADYFPRSGLGLGRYCKPCHVRIGTRNERRRREDAGYRERRRKQWRDEAHKRRMRDPIRDAEIKWRSANKLRSEMVEAYGGACSCCGEREVGFLTLEHVNGDGAKHRESLRTLGGYAVWRDLKKRGWPTDGYTILCWNCHMATCWGRTCPHQQGNRSAVTVTP